MGNLWGVLSPTKLEFVGGVSPHRLSKMDYSYADNPSDDIIVETNTPTQTWCVADKLTCPELYNEDGVRTGTVANVTDWVSSVGLSPRLWEFECAKGHKVYKEGPLRYRHVVETPTLMPPEMMAKIPLKVEVKPWQPGRGGV